MHSDIGISEYTVDSEPVIFTSLVKEVLRNLDHTVPELCS